MRTDEAKNYLERAIARLEHADCHLLVVNVSERCIAARLAMYLREYFVDYDVDVEYNRHGPDVKQLHEVVQDCPRDRDDEGQSVLPDVVVHRRGGDDSNLLVIEMKKSSNQSRMDSDRKRIRAFCKELGYNVGALVVCKTGHRPAISVDWVRVKSGQVWIARGRRRWRREMTTT